MAIPFTVDYPESIWTWINVLSNDCLSNSWIDTFLSQDCGCFACSASLMNIIWYCIEVTLLQRQLILSSGSIINSTIVTRSFIVVFSFTSVIKSQLKHSYTGQGFIFKYFNINCKSNIFLACIHISDKTRVALYLICSHIKYLSWWRDFLQLGSEEPLLVLENTYYQQ